MALATKCPQCGALFRVVADQLKLRGGLVRCGQCRAVFDAIGSLTYIDDAALTQTRTVSALTKPLAAPAPAPAPPPVANVGESSAAAARQVLGPATTLRITPGAPATLAGTLAARAEPASTARSDERVSIRQRAKAAARRRAVATEPPREAHLSEAGVPTLLAPEIARQPASPPLAEGIEVVELAPPPRDDYVATVGADDSEPEFIRPQRRDRRGFSIVFGGGTLLLALLAATQLAVIFRGDVLAHWPQARLLMVDLCSVFRCTVSWPTRPDQLAVMGSELQSLPGTDVLELTAVIRNRAAFRQALPALEVTLTDTRNQALARKAFAPADYLASAGELSSRIQEGLGPGSDLTIRIFFEARGVRPAGFLVYPFYL
jgi:predicted Zn finger-like uncharacterized protein